MVVIRQNLLDRIDQIYGFFDVQTEVEMEEFIEEITKIKNRKPHNYNFLKKYLQYLKTIKPKLVGNAEKRLNRFWIKCKIKRPIVVIGHCFLLSELQKHKPNSIFQMKLMI